MKLRKSEQSIISKYIKYFPLERYHNCNTQESHPVKLVVFFLILS